MADEVRELIIEQRKRLVASLLSEAESTLKPKVSAQEWNAFRSKVLDSVGTYHDFILDVLKVSRRSSVLNEEAVRLIKQIHVGQQRLIENDLNGRS